MSCQSSQTVLNEFPLTFLSEFLGFVFWVLNFWKKFFFNRGLELVVSLCFFVITKTKKKIKETDIVNNNNNYVINIKSTFDKQLVTINKKKQQNRMTNVVAQQLSF